MKNRFAFAALLVSPLFLTTVHALPSYEIQSLGSLNPSFVNSQANGINNLGQVVGSATNQDFLTEAFIWDSTNGIQGLGFLPDSTDSQASAINDNGEVVGRSMYSGFPGAGTPEHFIWDSTNGMNHLGRTDPMEEFAFANDINNSSQVVGTSVYTFPPSSIGAGGGNFPTTWNAGTGVERLPVFAAELGNGGGQAYGINEAGYTVGDVSDFGAPVPDPAGSFEAVIWDPSQNISALQNLFGTNQSSAVALNDGNQIVGWERNTNGVDRALFWENPTAVPVELGLFDPTDSFTRGNAINNDALIVGDILNSTLFPGFPPTTLATIWENNVAHYLGNLLADPQNWLALLSARDINEHGQIVGMGVKFGPQGAFEFEAFLLNPLTTTLPVPEPSALSLIVVAIAMLIVFRTRKDLIRLRLE